jgi:FkbM family methyltransferase
MNFSEVPKSSVVGRILRAPLRLIPEKMPMPILQGRLRGKKWIAGAHTHGCWLGSYENEKQKQFASTIKEGDTVFDIGANAGFYTLLASVLVGSGGRVYAFEPLPRNIKLLREHLRLNQITNVEVIEAAVSDADGESYFDDSAGSAMGYVSATGNLKVKTVAIDDLVARGEIGSPACVKIDVEGSELLVLTGGRRLLENYRPALFLSTHGPGVHEECCSLLRSLGYELRAIGGDNTAATDEIVAR